MASIEQVIFFSLIGGVVSLIGGVFLLSSKKSAKHLSEYATPFAAGALLAAAFLDLLKEGIAESNAELVLFWTLGGMILFFVLESTLRWFHHHHEHEGHGKNSNGPLIVIGDTVHNFIDGVAIAAAFLISVPTGIVTTLAVSAHEIPQEIGDFGLLLSKGYARRKVLLINVMSALATTVGAVLFFKLGANNPTLIGALTGMTAGFFIYIATSDIIPSIHETAHRRTLYIKSLLLVAGVVIVGTLTSVAHNYIDAGHDHDHNEPTTSQHADEDDH